MRAYDHDRDFDALTRIWEEVGWIDRDDEGDAAGLRAFARTGHGLVADVDGSAECFVHRTKGSFRYVRTDLPLCAVTAVTTSHVARKQGLATGLVARLLAEGSDSGAAVAALGAFEQGYYDRFGFGSGPYEHSITVDPASLAVPVPERPPVRVGVDDAADLHALLARRHRSHGGLVLDEPGQFEAELRWLDDPFGLGFRDPGDGRLTHALAGSTKDEHGPYVIRWLAYETPEQLLELLGVVRSLGDQVRYVRFDFEPAEIQLQDLVNAPVRQQVAAELAGHAIVPHAARAWWQLRIMDLAACVAAVRWVGEPVVLGLALHDPLPERAQGWPGIGGEWTLRLAEESSATTGAPPAGTPVLSASVNALSRLWAGVRPATSLALTDDLAGPPELLRALDDVFCLPPPRPGWSF